jgi:hypothetical protein
MPLSIPPGAAPTLRVSDWTVRRRHLDQGGFGYDGGRRYDLVVRYPAFEYVPEPANFALTDTRAQHRRLERR